jgi:tetratricopeptide (TPR) repeat protein
MISFFLLSTSIVQAGNSSGVFYGPIVPAEDITAITENQPKWMVLWELGRKLVREGELQDAVKVYALLLFREKNIDEARWELARIRVALGELDKAAVVLETILERSPKQVRTLNGLAYISQLNGHLERAVTLYQQVADDLDPENAVSLRGLSESLQALGRKNDALPYLEKLVRMSNDMQSRTDLARSYYELGFYEKARPLSVSLASANNAALFHIRLAARIHSELGLEDLAAEYWRRIVSASPQDEEAHLWLSSFYDERKRYTDSLQNYLVLYTLNPDEPKYLFSISQAYMYRDKMEEALDYLNAYLSHKPYDQKAIRNLINIHVALGNEVETLSSLDRYFDIESYPSTGQLRQAAKLYDEVGRYHDAIPIYRQLLEKNPNDKRLLATLANDLLAIGEDEGALTILSDLARISPDNKEIYVAMAGLLEKLNRHDERILILEAIHALDPEDHDVTLDLVLLYTRQGKLEKSYALFSSIDDTHFTSVSLLEKRASIFLFHGMEQHALQDYEELLRIDNVRDDIRLKCIQINGSLGLIHGLEEHVAVLLPSLGITYGNYEPGRENEKDDNLVLQRLGHEKYLQLANSYRDAGKIEAALFMYQMLQAQFRDKESFYALVCTEIAQLYQSQGLKFKAEQALRMALLHGEDQWTAMSHLVRLGLAENNLDDAGIWLTLLRYVRPERSALGVRPREDVNSLSESLEIQRQLLEIQWDRAGGKFQAAIRKAKALQKSLAASQNSPQGFIPLKEGLKRVPPRGVHFFQGAWFDTPITRYDIDIELLRSYIGQEKYERAESLCRKLIAGNSYRLLPQVLLYQLLLETAPDEDAYAQYNHLLEIADQDLGQLLKLAAFFKKADDLNSMKKVLIFGRQKAPGSFKVAVNLAEAYFLLNDFTGLSEELERMSKDFPGNIQLTAFKAVAHFQLGEYGKAIEACDSVLSVQPDHPDILFLQARIFWRNRQQEKSLEVIERYLSVSADSLLRDSAAKEGMALPPDADPNFWRKITRATDWEQRYIDKVMTPSFTASTENRAVSLIATPLYALYSWQELFAGEFQVRRALARKEYIGASHYISQLLEKYPEDEMLIFDLAETYAFLGNSEDEAVLYSRLDKMNPEYPGLSAAKERNRLKRQPRLMTTYRYRKEDGWNGYKDIRESVGRLGYQRSLAPGHDVTVSASHHRYTDADGDGTLMSNRLTAFFHGDLFHRVDFKVGGGVEALESDEGNTGLFALELESRITDKVYGNVSYHRDVVTDTLASLGRNIVAEKIRGALSFDLSPYFNTGGSYGLKTYSDGNELYGYSLWGSLIFMTEPALLRFTYMYDFQDARESNQQDGPLLDDGFSAGDHPYWSPRNYWENSFGIYWKQYIFSEMLEKEAPSYYTVEYIIDYDSTGHERQSLKGGLAVELDSHFILESGIEFISSDNYRASDLSLTAVYRW